MPSRIEPGGGCGDCGICVLFCAASAVYLAAFFAVCGGERGPRLCILVYFCVSTMCYLWHAQSGVVGISNSNASLGATELAMCGMVWGHSFYSTALVLQPGRRLSAFVCMRVSWWAAAVAAPLPTAGKEAGLVNSRDVQQRLVVQKHTTAARSRRKIRSGRSGAPADLAMRAWREPDAAMCERG